MASSAKRTPLSIRSRNTWSSPVWCTVRSIYPEPPVPAWFSRPDSRKEFPLPGSVVTSADASTFGPYIASSRHAVHVVVRVPSSWFDATRRPVSADPMPFDQRPTSDSGFSFRRSKQSTTGNGSTAGARSASASPGPRSRRATRRRVARLHQVVVGGAVRGRRVRVTRGQAGAGRERASEDARGRGAIHGVGRERGAAVRAGSAPRE